MRFGIFGDIHSNLEALEAVLEDMQAQAVTHTVCIGDIVGYNANPRECLEIVRRARLPHRQGQPRRGSPPRGREVEHFNDMALSGDPLYPLAADQGAAGISSRPAAAKAGQFLHRRPFHPRPAEPLGLRLLLPRGRKQLPVLRRPTSASSATPTSPTSSSATPRSTNSSTRKSTSSLRRNTSSTSAASASPATATGARPMSSSTRAPTPSSCAAFPTISPRAQAKIMNAGLPRASRRALGECGLTKPYFGAIKSSASSHQARLGELGQSVCPQSLFRIIFFCPGRCA